MQITDSAIESQKPSASTSSTSVLSNNPFAALAEETKNAMQIEMSKTDSEGEDDAPTNRVTKSSKESAKPLAIQASSNRNLILVLVIITTSLALPRSVFRAYTPPSEQL